MRGFPIALALGTIILAPGADAREPTPIRTCQTISEPGSYELAHNLAATGACLMITADFVTIDLAAFHDQRDPNTPLRRHGNSGRGEHERHYRAERLDLRLRYRG